METNHKRYKNMHNMRYVLDALTGKKRKVSSNKLGADLAKKLNEGNNFNYRSE